MSDFNWCHGPQCHEKHTVDRVRGVKGSKVLRTRKVKRYNMNRQERYWYDYFCSQQCYDNFANKYIDQVLAIAPRTEALETPILNPEKKTHTYTYGMNNEYSYNRTETKIEVDETRQID